MNVQEGGRETDEDDEKYHFRFLGGKPPRAAKNTPRYRATWGESPPTPKK